MRFVTEFDLPNNFDLKLLDHLVPDKKHIRELGIGQDIGRLFGWQTSEKDNSIHCKLEVEAFPMDKWVEFKQKLFTYIYEAGRRGEVLNQIHVLELIKELESFGQPTKDSESLLDNDIQYRGPNSHCKACEDEKAGIKHIKASKHTCKR